MHGNALRTLLAAGVMISGLAACQEKITEKQETAPVRSITVNGEGFVEAKPDLAIVSVGVVAQGPTAADALAENSKRMSGLLDLIKGLGIDPRDVQTTNLQVSPRYSAPDPQQPNNASMIVGYDASNDVTVRIRDLGKLGAALDKFVSTAGANNLHGLVFDFANPDPLTDQARKNAVADAQHKAVLYTDAAKVRLGAIQSIGESGGYMPKQVYNMMAARAAPVPIAAGESRIAASVSITYAIQ